MIPIKNEFKINLTDVPNKLKQKVLSTFGEYHINLFQKFDSIRIDESKILYDNIHILLLQQYFKLSLLTIKKTLKKIAFKKDNNYFILIELLSPIVTLEFEINSHITKEKQFFRVNKYLLDCESFKERPKMRGFNSVQFLIRNLEIEHNKILLFIRQIQKLTNNFALQHNTLYTFLKSLYSEIHYRITAIGNCIFRENQTVFPKTIIQGNNLLNINRGK